MSNLIERARNAVDALRGVTQPRIVISGCQISLVQERPRGFSTPTGFGESDSGVRRLRVEALEEALRSGDISIRNVKVTQANGQFLLEGM